MKAKITDISKRFCLLASAMCFPLFFLMAQDTAILQGQVNEQSSGAPLPGAAIILENGRGTTAEVSGAYSIKTTAGQHRIICRMIGFESDTQTVTLQAGASFSLDFSLNPVSEQLRTVVISAGRFEQELSEVTVSMELLKPDLVENKNTYNMENIVDQVPGVHVMDGQANIRGGSGFSYGAGSRVMVLVDDLPLLSGDAGDVKWNFLPVENLEQIEVIKGASSALFGSSALNGVIHIRTAYPKDTPQTHINVFQGFYFDPVRADSTGNKRDSAGRWNKPLRWWGDVNPMYTGANFYHMRKAGRFDFVIGGNAFSDQGYREGETEQRYRMNFNTRYRFKKIRGLSVRLNANAQHNDGSLFLLWQDADSGAYRPMGGVDTPATSLSRFTTIRANIDPSVVYFGKKGGKHTLRGRYYNTTNRNNTRQASVADIYYSEYQFQKRYLNELSVTLGGVYSRTVVRSQMYGDHAGDNIAGFGQIDKRTGRFTFSLGLRGEYYKVDTARTTYDISTGGDTATFPFYPVFRSGLNFKAAKATFLRMSFGQGYRFPSIAEKFVHTSVGSSLRLFPNPEVMPETGWSAEIGLKQGFKINRWNGYLDVSGFWTEYNDMIEFTFGLYNPDSVQITLFNLNDWLGFQAQNVGRAQIRGVDASIAGEGKIGDFGLSVLAGYTYMDPLNLNKDSTYLASKSDSASNMLKYRFRHLAKADIQLDYKRWSVGWSLRYNSAIANVDAIFERPLIGNIYITPGVADYRKTHDKGDAVFDARLSCKVSEESKIALICNNVFNREYMGRPADMQPPRTLAVQYALVF